MKKTYTITEEKKNEALQLIRKNGGKIYKNNSFEISGVKGYYKESGDSITIVITDKPWLASWSMIEDKLDEFFK